MRLRLRNAGRVSLRATAKSQRTRIGVGLLAVCAPLVFVLPGIGADGISPVDPTSVVMGQGSDSQPLAKTLHLDALPGKADVEIAIDTTGSMAGGISDATTSAAAIVAGVQAAVPDTTFAVVQFKDYCTAANPTSGPGCSMPGGDPYPGDSPEYSVVQSMTATAADVTTALGTLSAKGGGDAPEAHNQVFHNSYTPLTGGDIGWRAGSRKFVVVISDAQPHGDLATQGFAGCIDESADPHVPVLSTTTELAGMKAAQRTLLMIHETDDGNSTNLGCYQSLAAAAFPSGKAVEAGGSLSDQIIALVQEAETKISHVGFSVPESYSSWISFSPASFGDTGTPLTAPKDLSFTETLHVPAGTPVGVYTFDVHVIVDGVDRATQPVSIDVRRQAISSPALSVDEASIPAGIASVPLASIPAARLAFLTGNYGAIPNGSLPGASIPGASIPGASIPGASIPGASIPGASIPGASIPAGMTLGQIGLFALPGASIPGASIPGASIPGASIAFDRILLSSIPLNNPPSASWDAVLSGITSLAGRPLNAITLADVVGNSTALGRLKALRLRDVGLAGGLLGDVRFASMLIGNVPLQNIPPPGGAATWCAALTSAGGSCTNLDPTTNTVLGVELAGQLGGTDVGSIKIGSIPGASIPGASIPGASIPGASINIPATRLGAVLLSAISPQVDVVDCALIDCATAAGKTLGDAYNAHAMKNIALGDLLAHIAAGNPARDMTIGELIAALIGVADLPWENIAVQGLQDVSGTGNLAHYHANFDLDCAITTSFSIDAALPNGFFPAAGTSKLTYGTGAPFAAGEPTVPDSSHPFTFEWSAPGDPCAGATATRHVRLDFSAYAGLRIGEQRGSLIVKANGLASSADDQAPIFVTQNNEPNDDPTTAPIIAKDTLVLEHIASASDVDFVRFPIAGLAPLTRVTAYLKVPDGADLDLAIDKPATSSFQSAPGASIPATNPIEDLGQTLDNSTAQLAPETLQDVPAAAPGASIPGASIPGASIPAASISANRGSVTEKATVVLHGEGGYLTIGTSSYAGSTTPSPGVLRIKVTPPPALPPCPARTFPNATPIANSLLASLPASTKTIFLVNRQRLVAMYGQATTDAMLSTIGDQATPGSFAARPEVLGSVLQVDGSAAVRAAYANWDANPCAVTAANDIVAKVNDVVNGYRNQPGGLPNLTYVVLLGTDEAVPMFRQSDLTTVSPELDEAGDLAFTTNNLTSGNALYASAAQNNVLTDGAYGVTSKLTWLGHDLPLAQLSVSRLVETPNDMKGQIDQYTSPAVNGILDPTTSTTTGYDFLTEGATAASNGIAANFAGISRDDLLPPISPDWDKVAFLSHFFNKAIIPSIGALNAHYTHYILQPAVINPLSIAGVVTTANVPASMAKTILFTMGCHAGLNVADSLGGDSVKLKDWAQAYAQSRAAVYVANSGYGYGETNPGESGLSERLIGLFGTKLNSDGGSIGQQWAGTLTDYYLSAGNYDVYDEKVMIEATFYGLPFYHFAHPGTPGGGSGVTPPHDDGAGLQVASVTVTPNAVEHSLPDGRSYWSAGSGVDDTLFRSVQPFVSQDVTVPGLQGRGAFITSLTTADYTGRKPVIASPTIDLAAHEATPNFANIFFPANVVKLGRAVLFNQEHDSLMVTAGQFRPDPGTDHGIQRIVTSIGVDVAYSNSANITTPLISQVGAVMTNDTTATLFIRTSDGANPLHRVGFLYNDGAHNWQFATGNLVSGDLYTATVSGLAARPEIVGESQSNGGLVAYSANKGFNFTAINDTSGPQIVIEAPTPAAVYQLNQKVRVHYACSDVGGTQSCGSPVPDGGLLDTSTVGTHTFTVTSTDLRGNSSVKTVSYVVRFGFGNFLQPVASPPTLNVANAGRTIPLKWSLKDALGGFVRDLSTITGISSSAMKCPTTATEPIPDTINAGTSSLKYDASAEQFIFNWQTDKAWAGTCRRLFLALSDATVQTAEFQFK